MRQYITIPLFAALIGIQPMSANADHKRSIYRPSLSANPWDLDVLFQNPAFRQRHGISRQGGLGHQSIGHQSIGHQSIGHPSIGHQSIGHPPLAHPPIGHHPEQVEATVREWYVTYLGREPEPAAYMNWVNAVLSGMALSEAHVGILASPECFARSQNDPHLYVQFIFRQVAGREPNPQERRTWVSLFFQRYHGERMQFTRDLLSSLGLY